MLGCLLGATGILAAAILSQRVQANTDRGTLAICAIIDYAESTLKNTPPEARADNPQAFNRFDQLIKDMKATGIKCPPPPSAKENAKEVN
jgi:hypothetical protein